ncbi:pitrilysin family protein [uncultured Streptomyces sp.]|uniref:M16 family metallopeptidase n=1 Tax=uncultured Streptomyces sp. TaxID=174707 RepID=UPI00261E6875|nr:insulinase family protein [uncultured Streptomyces sp.]
MNAPAPPVLPEPHFVPPEHLDTAGPRGTAVAVARPGAGGLAEARLLLPLAPAPAAHTTRTKIAAEVVGAALEEAVGALAVVRTEVRGDRLVIALRTFRDDLADVCGRVAATVAADGTFTPERVGRAAARVAEGLTAAAGHPAVVARNGFLAAVYGDHPYGRPATAAEAAAVTGPEASALLAGAPAAGRRAVVVGPGPADALLADATALLPGPGTPPSGPAASGPGPAQGPRPGPSGRGPVTLVLPAAPQTLIRLGGHVPGRGDRDYPALQLAVLMLGGYFGSRLTRVLREREGLAYAPRAVLDPLGRTAAFTVEADVRNDGAARALVLIREELDRLAAGGFTGPELSGACHYAVGSMAMACSSRSGTASTLTGVLASGLAPDWLRGYEDRLRATTAEDVARVAAAHLAPGTTGVVVAPALAPGLPPPPV